MAQRNSHGDIAGRKKFGPRERGGLFPPLFSYFSIELRDLSRARCESGEKFRLVRQLQTPKLISGFQSLFYDLYTIYFWVTGIFPISYGNN